MIHQDGRRAVVANPNVVVLYNQDASYRREQISHIGDRCDFLDIGRSVLVESIARYDPSVIDRVEAPFCWASCPVDATTLVHQRKSFRRARVGMIPAMELEESVLQIVDEVVDRLYAGRQISAQPSARSAATRAALVNESKRLISSRFRESLSINGIASELDVSASHLRRVFRQLANESMHQYLTKLRLRTALDEVFEATDLTEVALNLGFSSHSHFSASFRRVFGMCPSDWRQSGC